MINKKVHFLFLGTMLFVISCLCGPMSSFIPTRMPTRADILPAIGEWVAKADFGEIRFSVEATREISHWEFFLHTEPCGTGVLNSRYSSWVRFPIQENSFLLTHEGTKTMGGSRFREEYKLQGIFSADFKSASGTWEYLFNFGRCSGQWQAER